MERPTIPVFVGPGVRPAAVVRALQPHYEVQVTADPDRFLEGLGNSRCLVSVGRLASAAFPQDIPDPGRRRLLVVVSADPEPAAQLLRWSKRVRFESIHPADVPVDLLRLVCKGEVRGCLAEYEWAVRSHPELPRFLHLRAGLVTLFEDLRVRSIASRARTAECSPRTLQLEWAELVQSREAVGSNPNLKRLVMARILLEAVAAWLEQPLGSWTQRADQMGVSPRTLRNYLQTWGGGSLNSLRVEDVPSLVRRLEARTLAPLKLPKDGQRTA